MDNEDKLPTNPVCHCGSEMKGSDHCPFCGCEEYEATCESKYPHKAVLYKRAAPTVWKGD